MTRNRLRLMAALTIFWLVVSAVYWRTADWWAYVDEGGGKKPWPKFVMPLWFQAAESLLIGLAATAVLFGLTALGRRLFRKRTT
jgi:hypothetical protein